MALPPGKLSLAEIRKIPARTTQVKELKSLLESALHLLDPKLRVDPRGHIGYNGDQIPGIRKLVLHYRAILSSPRSVLAAIDLRNSAEHIQRPGDPVPAPWRVWIAKHSLTTAVREVAARLPASHRADVIGESSFVSSPEFEWLWWTLVALVLWMAWQVGRRAAI